MRRQTTLNIEAAGLAQRYGQRDVFSDVDLALGPGVFGLLGPNGAGKTTLLRTLAAVVPPSGGDLRICGYPVRGMADARAARRQVGYLPQHFGYFPGFTVYEFVRYCAWLHEVPAKDIHEATVRAIKSVDLADRARVKLRKLSGGMLRRCGVAQAIVGSPRLLLLDEPTVGLDPAQRLEFRELIRSLRDVTVVLSTHLVEDVTATCDEVFVMNEGRLRFRGTPQELADAAAPGALGDTPIERGYTTVLRAAEVTA
jgi:ABC-2 type transport system ATP-binding protein